MPILQRRKLRLTQASKYFGQDRKCGRRSGPGAWTPDAVLRKHQPGLNPESSLHSYQLLPNNSSNQCSPCHPLQEFSAIDLISYLTLKNIHITIYKLAQFPTIRQTHLFLPGSPHTQRGCPASSCLSPPSLLLPALSEPHSTDYLLSTGPWSSRCFLSTGPFLLVLNMLTWPSWCGPVVAR